MSWPAPAAAAEATQPAGLSLLKQHEGMEEVPAEGRCPGLRYQLAGRVTHGLMAHRQGRIYIVAPYGAISTAGELGCQPATIGRVRARVASTVTPRARAQTHSMAGAELVIVRKCPWQSGTVR